MSRAGGPTYVLRAPGESAEVPRLDEHQQAVVDHRGGPLLVLAGPGTGKTTTLVEAIVERVEKRGASPDSILALTFSRKAAEQLRDRVTARLGRTTATTLSSTFHSFAYALVRRYSTRDLYTDPLRLLSAPEQDVIVRGLLSREAESVPWPTGLAAALETRGFARELSDLMARTTERGVGSRRLREIGRAHGRADLVAAADFMEQYDAVLGSQNALDYPSLIADAVAMLQDTDHPARRDLRRQFEHVFVDEYQDTDPSQLALLRAIAGDGRNLTVVGDPHQSIYGFRGAEVRGILQFPTMFPRADGERADVVVLRSTRRFGPRILTASQRIAGRIGLPGTIGPAEQQAFLNPVAAGVHGAGRVEATTFDTPRAETEHLADLLRRAHLEQGIAWSDMAVLVRSGRQTIPTLRRSLMAAGVPIEVAADETPLVREPAVQPLLAALHAVADPGWLDAERAHALLVSPLAGLDVTDVRALARLLRRREQAGAGTARSSGELLREALVDPAVLAGLDEPVAARARALAGLLAAARGRLESGATVEEILWELWSGTAWPQRLRAAAVRGGAAARFAHRDLDAIVALFDNAARAEEQRAHTSVAAFLDTLRAQQIPADTLADRGVRGEAVRLLTAHRSKGLEWRLVVVAHVQEESWPDLRLRASLLRADEIGRAGLQDRVSTRELLAEERRLFYVACTRARERLVVTAVASPEDDGEQPSRFVEELGVQVQHRQGRPPRPLSLDGLVAELRRVVADDKQPDGLRSAAARRLARLAEERVGGRPLVPAADPATWWGTRAATRSDAPVRPGDAPVRLTASALTAIEECPARWFLEREAGGARASTQGQGFGKVVHALADRIGRGELTSDPEERAAVVEELMDRIDEVWAEIPFRMPWSAAREREEARAAITRFLDWHGRPEARTVLATEQEVRAAVTLPDGSEVALHGFADRLEIDDDGRVVVIDLKTTKYPPTDKEIPTNAQLGLYQLAVEQGAVDHLLDAPGVPGGAELWQLRKEARGELKVQFQAALEPGDERVIEEQLAEAVAVIRAEEFPTRPGGHCDRCAFRPMCPAQSSQTVLH